MTLAEWMIFTAVILYLITVAPLKAAEYKTFDNSKPRDLAFCKLGIATRALGAHVNELQHLHFLLCRF